MYLCQMRLNVLDAENTLQKKMEPCAVGVLKLFQMVGINDRISLLSDVL